MTSALPVWEEMGKTGRGLPSCIRFSLGQGLHECPLATKLVPRCAYILIFFTKTLQERSISGSVSYSQVTELGTCVPTGELSSGAMPPGCAFSRGGESAPMRSPIKCTGAHG